MNGTKRNMVFSPNSKAPEIDVVNLKFVEYQSIYDEEYLKGLRDKAKSWISKIDPDSWLREIRGEYDE